MASAAKIVAWLSLPFAVFFSFVALAYPLSAVLSGQRLAALNGAVVFTYGLIATVLVVWTAGWFWYARTHRAMKPAP